MAGNAIGSTSSNILFNWTGGTLMNVSGLNGTSGITVNTGNQFNPVYLTGTNTFTSTITIKDSILQLESNTALSANSKIGFNGTAGILKLGSGVTTDVSSNLSNGNAQLDTNGNNVLFSNSVSGLTSFTKLGSGKLTLSSTGGNLAPTVNILGGTLELGNGDNQIPAGGFLNGTTALTLDAIGGSPELSASGVKVDLNADVNLLNSGATISGTKGTSNYSFNFIKDIISQNGSTATLSATDMITGSNSHINVGTGATLTISGSFIDGVNPTQITKNGTGTLEFTGTGNTYSGATSVNAGSLTISQDALAGASTSISVNNGASLTAVNLGANVSLTVANGGAADLSGTGLDMNELNVEGTLVLSGNTPTLTVGSGTLNGSITATDTTSLVKKGSGTLTISTNSNFIAGSVTLNDGILSVSDLATLGTASDSFENLVFQGGKLQYTGAGTEMTRDFTVGNGGAGFNASGTGALIIGQDAQMDFVDGSASNRTLSLGGTTDIAIENIYNPAKFDSNDINNLFTKLVKQETNKWIVLGSGSGFADEAEIDLQNGELGFEKGALGKNPTFNIGATAVGATATLTWVNGNNDDISGRTNLTNAASAAFNIPSNTTVNFDQALNGGAATTASLTKLGGGALNLNAKNDFSGGFTISGGIVKAGITGAVGSGTVTVNTNSTFVVNAILANRINVNSGGTLTSDQENQDVGDTTVEQDGLLVPGGNLIGTMNIHNLTLKGGSLVNWQITDATGAAINNFSKAGTGYDTFILNSLSLTDASLSKRIHVQVQNIFGNPAANFDNKKIQTFKFAKLATKLNSDDAAHVTDLFEIDAVDFEYIGGLKTDNLVWRMTVSADNQYLYVVVIPEPSTYGLGLGALALAAAAVRRRKQKKNPPTV